MLNLLERLHRDIKHYPIGVKWYDKDGKRSTRDADLINDHRVDISDVVNMIGNTDNSGNTTPDTPSAGADYYAGSLADGEITERNLEWAGTDDPTKSTKITFKDDPGGKAFGQYTGLTILGYIQKTIMAAGIKRATSTINLNYDPNNVAKSGMYTTTSPYPIYIKSEDLIVGKKLAIPINGIGEDLSGKNTKATTIYLTYNADKTMTLEHDMGYDNDGESAGATGANYQFIAKFITTFSKQNAIAQLPAAVNFFNGNATGDIALTGVSKYFEDSMDGLEISFDKYAYYSDPYNGIFSEYPGATVRVDMGVLGLNKIKIPKEYLIIGTSYDYSNQIQVPSGEVTVDYKPQNSSTYHSSKGAVGSIYMVKLAGNFIKINNSSINVTLGCYLRMGNNTVQTVPAITNVVKITPYKD